MTVPTALILTARAETKPTPEQKPEPAKSLHQAAANDDIEQVKLLISKGADVNEKDKKGWTPLHLASVKGHKNIVEILIAKGAYIEAKDNAGCTPLHYAAGAGSLNWTMRVGYPAVAQFLLGKGADVNAKDKYGWTPLHYAVCQGNKVMVDFLLTRRAKLNATNERRHTPLSLARGIPPVHKGLPTENEITNQYREIDEVLRKHGVVYYVATDGKDSAPGTLDHPFRTLCAAINVAEPGDTIFVRGGIYPCSSTIVIDKSGQEGKPIRLIAYPGDTPIFDFSAAKGDGFFVTGAHWHIKGLTISHAPGVGLQLEGDGSHHNVIEQVQAHSNGDTGIDLTSGAEYNLILNCDSYRNFDQPTNGENADGFGAKFRLGQGNIFVGCRSWNNADDGFDCWYAGSCVRMENCFACRNGQNIWGHPGFTGNANGFKLGQMEGAHIVIRCTTWEHPGTGFDLNGNSTGVTLYNCTALRNRIDYDFTFTKGNIKKNTLRNNVSLGGDILINPAVNQQHNSWSKSLGIHITQEDFLSLDDRVITGPRNPDGSIPESYFLRLAPVSDLIDAGTDVGLPFVGKAPDLGAFEYRPAETKQKYIKMLHQTVRDHDIEQVRSLLSDGADVNEKDWLGYTALHWSIYFGYSDVAEILIAAGANPNIKSDTGRTPLEIATDMDYNHLAELLRKHGAKE